MKNCTCTAYSHAVMLVLYSNSQPPIVLSAGSRQVLVLSKLSAGLTYEFKVIINLQLVTGLANDNFNIYHTPRAGSC